jgi:nitrate/nitrite transporter NarK
MDLGLSTSQAAVLLSFVGGASVAGRLVLGALVDRIGCRNALSLCLLILMFALGAYAVTSTTQLLFVVTAVYGFAHGALFVVVSPTVAYYFGMKAHGAIFGSVLFMGTFGSPIGPIAAGASFDLLGSYLPAFIALALFAALALVLARSLPKLPEELPRS